MSYHQEPSLGAKAANPNREIPEWIIHAKAARNMVDTFPERLTEFQRKFFHLGSKMPVIMAIAEMAKDAKKCKSLNSVEYLCSSIKTLEGWHKVTYYHVGDVVLVTTPGRMEGQKFVSAIFSLTEKLGRLEETRRVVEISGRRKIPMTEIRKMRKNHNGRNYFKNNN